MPRPRDGMPEETRVALPDVVAQGHHVQVADRGRLRLLDPEAQLVEEDRVLERGRRRRQPAVGVVVVVAYPPGQR